MLGVGVPGRDLLFCLSMLLLTAYGVLLVLLPETTGPLVLAVLWLRDVSLAAGYPGAFAVSFLGNATLLVPFPYLGVPFFMGGVQAAGGTYLYDPWLTGLVSGIGAMLGEMTGYALGAGGRRCLDPARTEALNRLLLHHRHRVPFLVWFLAVTPLPDDVLVVPLGTVRYDWRVVFVAGAVGKTMFLTAVSWAGRSGMTWLEGLLGLSGQPGPLSGITEVLALMALVVVLYLVARVDWDSVTRRALVDTPADTH